MQASGESLADIRSSLTGAAASAKGAVDRNDAPAAACAPAAPAEPPARRRSSRPPSGRLPSPTRATTRRGPPETRLEGRLVPLGAGRPGYLRPMTEIGTLRVKTGLAEMLKGGVIMDVVDADQARIAEEAGACAVMALERVPADIRRDGGVARMSDPKIARSRRPSRSP